MLSGWQRGHATLTDVSGNASLRHPFELSHERLRAGQELVSMGKARRPAERLVCCQDMASATDRGMPMHPNGA